MNFQDLIFYIFSAILIASALGVITVRNPVYSALLLVVAFVSCAGLWLLLEAEFLAIALVLVYVGAVMVLFLFVVMMLVAMVAAIALTLRHREDKKSLNPSKQVQVKKQDRIRIVAMPSEKKE